jgi:hypothetical protein
MPHFNSNFAVNDDLASRFTRTFTSIYPDLLGKKIIYFGYKGLEENAMSPGELNSVTYDKENPDQKYQKLVLHDEFPSYNSARFLQKWEKEEYKKKIDESEVIGIA